MAEKAKPKTARTAAKPRPAAKDKALDTAMKNARVALEDALPRTLPACRREIDKVDETIIALLDRRARIARKVGELKAKAGGDFFDAGRHLNVLNGISRRGKGDFPTEGLRNVYGEILSVCLNLQSPQTIAYLGPEGTYSHIAARRAFGRSPIFAPYETIGDIFLAVEKNWAHFGIVPIENSTGGVIHATLDELMGSELSICAEVYIPIRHNLMCLGPREGIKRIATHPQVLSQCRIWLRENMSNVKQFETPSTAEGAHLALKDMSTATIGSIVMSELYKLPILERGIEDQKDNVTRFIVIGKQRPRPSGNDRTSVMFSIKDEPGALYHLLKPFADKKINLTKIESRPTRRRAWDYNFFVDVEGHISSKEVQRAIDRLQRHCTFLRVLGSYPVDRHQDNGR